MSKRTISLADDAEYEFRANSYYSTQWNFLPDKASSKVIAQQLTYLDFHAWLVSKLRHTTTANPTEPSPLVFDVADGFHRTDVLLYGSICETALYVGLRHLVGAGTGSIQDEVRKCFEKREGKFTPMDSKTFLMANGSNQAVIGYQIETTKQVSNSEIKFSNLIRASGKIGICDKPLAEELDRLRAERNTIHLAVNLKRREDENRGFGVEDRARARKTTEKLRLALKNFLAMESQGNSHPSEV